MTPEPDPAEPERHDPAADVDTAALQEAPDSTYHTPPTADDEVLDPWAAARDRVQSARLNASPAPKPRPWARLLGLAFLGAAVGVGVLTWTGGSDEDTDLLARLGDASAEFRPQLVTVDASAAERFVLDAFGWPVAAPSLPELQLVGVGESSVLQTPELDVSMPAFRYDSPDGESLVVFVYDYVLLDGTQGALDLPEPIYARLAEASPVDSRRQEGVSFVTWRVRSVVYTAVTESEAIAEQIARGVSG